MSEQQPIQPTPPPGYAPAPTTPPSSEGFRSVISTILLLVLAPIIAIMLTMYVFQSYEVDGPSMETTLHNHDRLIVLKLPRTVAKITRHPYIPNRGDVIIFNKTGLGGIDHNGSKQLIKRVIGLPGERVVVKDGQLTVYNQAHPEGFSPDKTMPYGVVIGQTAGNVDVIVPDNEVFVSGDNRPNSLDSRYFGTVPASDIVGKLGLKVYPFNESKVF